MSRNQFAKLSLDEFRDTLLKAMPLAHLYHKLCEKAYLTSLAMKKDKQLCTSYLNRSTAVSTLSSGLGAALLELEKAHTATLERARI